MWNPAVTTDFWNLYRDFIDGKTHWVEQWPADIILIFAHHRVQKMWDGKDDRDFLQYDPKKMKELTSFRFEGNKSPSRQGEVDIKNFKDFLKTNFE